MATASAALSPESAFLEGQAGEARQRLGRSLAALPHNMRHAVSPLAWTVRFPLPAIGATILGAVALALALDHRLHRPAPAVVRPLRPRRNRGVGMVRGLVRRFAIAPLRAALMARVRGLI